jgi:hypothetical protein
MRWLEDVLGCERKEDHRDDDAWAFGNYRPQVGES